MELEIKDTSEKKKEWNKPIIFSLNLNKTSGGGDPATSEATQYDPDGGGGS